MNKKGASLDNIWTIIVFFGLCLFFIGVSLFWNAVSTEADDLWGGSSIGNEIKGDAQAAVNQFDWILVFVWAGMHLGILATAFLLRTHPVMYLVSIFLIVIIALLAAPISNAYEDMADDAELQTTIAGLPMSNYVMLNLPMLEIVWGFLTTIVMFALAKYEGVL